MAVFAVFVVRIAAAWLDRPAREPAPALNVSVVLPVYNEDPQLLEATLDSLSGQTRLPGRVWVLDDGSDDRSAFELAQRYQSPFELQVVRFETNRGKRHVQGHAFRLDVDAEVFVTADSDTALDPSAIEEGLRPFAHSQVSAVAGIIRASNRTRNLLTRLQDAEYLSSFLLGRAFMSVFHSVLVTAGGLAFYRAVVVREHLEEYLHQSFRGGPVVSGDDRMLAQLSLIHGRVVLQHTALAYTAVPERLSHLVRQRMRWSESFWIGGLWCLERLPVRSRPFWLTVFFLGTAVSGMLVMIAMVTLAPVLGGLVLAGYVAAMVALAYVRAFRLLVVGLPGDRLAVRLTSYLFVGPVALLSIVAFMPLRWYSLIVVLTGKTATGWGTRKHVEVTV